MAKKRKRNKEPKQEWYPCIVTELQPEDPGHDRGVKFTIEDFDGQMWHLADKPRLMAVLADHNLYAVKPERMHALRDQKQRVILV